MKERKEVHVVSRGHSVTSLKLDLLRQLPKTVRLRPTHSICGLKKSYLDSSNGVLYLVKKLERDKKSNKEVQEYDWITAIYYP